MSLKKNICITINSLSRGGAEKQSLLLAKALKSSHNIIFVILRPRPIYRPRLQFIKDEGIKHVFLSVNPIKKLYQFVGLLKREKIDVIFSFLPADSTWSAICGKLSGISHIFGGLRNCEMPWHKALGLKYIHNFFLYRTISNNHAGLHYVIDLGFKDKFVVIHNGIETLKQVPKRSGNKNTVIIVTAGRLVKQKDYPTALDCISSLKKRNLRGKKIKYVILGSGPEHDFLIAQIKKLGLENEVKIITNETNIDAWLKKSDIYLSTSKFEGMSNSIMEAMNCALPLVVTNVGDNNYLVSDPKNGYLVPLGQKEQLTTHLEYLINAPEEREKMGLESHNSIAKNFSYGNFQKKYLDLIQSLDI